MNKNEMQAMFSEAIAKCKKTCEAANAAYLAAEQDAEGKPNAAAIIKAANEARLAAIDTANAELNAFLDVQDAWFAANS
jgi:hypothetical protein